MAFSVDSFFESEPVGRDSEERIVYLIGLVIRRWTRVEDTLSRQIGWCEVFYNEIKDLPNMWNYERVDKRLSKKVARWQNVTNRAFPKEREARAEVNQLADRVRQLGAMRHDLCHLAGSMRDYWGVNVLELDTKDREGRRGPVVFYSEHTLSTLADEIDNLHYELAMMSGKAGSIQHHKALG